MKAAKLIVRVLPLAVLLAACAAEQREKAAAKASPDPSSQVAAAPEPVLEPKAIDVLKAASSRLAAARSMSFTAVVSYESPSVFGLPLIYTTRSQVTLRRPDRLRVVTAGDGPASEFYYDGKEMVAFEPAANLAAVAAAPPTIDAALEAAFESSAIYFPFTDVVVTDFYGGIADGMTQAFYIGQSKVIGGTTTDMVAILNDTVFEQIWIGADDKLPRMMRAVFLGDPLALRQQIEFSDWRLDSVGASETFTSPRAKKAPRIPFERPDPAAPPEGAAADHK